MFRKHESGKEAVRKIKGNEKKQYWPKKKRGRTWPPAGYLNATDKW